MIILLSQIKIAVSGLELQISPVQIFTYNIKGYNIYIIIYISVVDWGGGGVYDNKNVFHVEKSEQQWHSSGPYQYILFTVIWNQVYR